MSSPQVYGPYLTLIVFLVLAVIAVGREFWNARGFDKALPLGRACVAIPIAVFSADHITQAHDIMRGVPSWMPGKLFWTYFVGLALLAASLSFLFRVRMRLAATLLGFMFFCFVVMMDIEAIIRVPHNRFAWALGARESVFGAGAIVLSLASLGRKRTPGESRASMAAFYWVAVITMFYGVMQFFHPECVPAVPLSKKTPAYIPFAPLWTVLTATIMVTGAGAMFAKNIGRQAAAVMGAWVVLMVLTFYLAIMLAQLNIEGVNYFCDTLMFGGILLIASHAYEFERKPGSSAA